MNFDAQEYAAQQSWTGGVMRVQAAPRDHDGTGLSPQAKAALATQWHGRQINDHVYTGPLDKDHAVFQYNKLDPGPYAQMLSRPVGNTAKQPPGGRFRGGDDFFVQRQPTQ
jgi:hypothetical protein